jgi:hypothetical protein
MAAVLDLGWGWHSPDRPRDGLLSWWPDCGAVVVDGPDGLDVLGFIADEAEIRRRLQGWEEVANQPDALAWARARVAGQDERLGEVARSCPAPDGAAVASVDR